MSLLAGLVAKGKRILSYTAFPHISSSLAADIARTGEQPRAVVEQLEVIDDVTLGFLTRGVRTVRPPD